MESTLGEEDENLASVGNAKGRAWWTFGRMLRDVGRVYHLGDGRPDRVAPEVEVCPMRCLRPSLFYALCRLPVAAFAALGLAGIVQGSESPASAFLPLQGAVVAPVGAGSICQTYDWACAGASNRAAVGPHVLKQAVAINLAANAKIRPLSDMDQYAAPEHWALPTARGGDCEDYVLFKKKALVEAGVSPDRLLIAAVLDRKRSVHAVLVLRTETGDFVLDNLTDRVLPWDRTGYAFLLMQDPREPSRWVATNAQAGVGLSS